MKKISFFRNGFFLFAQFLLTFGVLFPLVFSSCDDLNSNEPCKISVSVQIPSEDSAKNSYKQSDIQFWRTELYNIQTSQTYFLPSTTSNQVTKIQMAPISTPTLSKGELSEGKYVVKSYGFDKAGTQIAFSGTSEQFSIDSGDSKNLTSQLEWSTAQESDKVTVRFYDVYNERLISTPFTVKKGEAIPSGKIPVLFGEDNGFFSDIDFENEFDFSEPIERNTTVWAKTEYQKFISEIYVSDAGDDSNSGEKEKPIASFEKAFQIIQRQNDTATDYVIYASGTFTKKVTLTLLPIRSLTISSLGTATAIFDGEASHSVIQIKDDVSKNITLKNLTIQNGYARHGAGINHAGTGLLTLKNCVISSNRAENEIVTNEDGSTTTKNANAGGVSVSNGSLAVIDTEITNNYAQYNGGAIHISSGGTLTISGNSKISYNSADYTAAAVSVNNGTCTMRSGIISHNSGGKGAAVTIQRYGTFIFEGGTIEGNTTSTNPEFPSSGTAGAIFINANLDENLFGTFTMRGGKLSQNSAEGNGGAVYNNGGVFNFEGGEITQNSAKAGAAIYINMGVVNMSGGSISRNTAEAGAGIFLAKENAVLSMTGGTITTNSASDFGGAVFFKDGAFAISGTAFIPCPKDGNDVYLSFGKGLEVIGTLSQTGKVATITPANYSEGTQVLVGTYVSTEYKKFAITEHGSSETWTIDSEGALLQANCLPVLYVSSSGNDGNSGKTADTAVATLNQAINLLNSYSELHDLANEDWEIYVSGTITGTTQINTVYAKSLLLSGSRSSSTDVLDANLSSDEHGSVLSISTSVPITIKNLKITGGNASVWGGGIEIGSNGNVTISTGALITENNSEVHAGGIVNSGTLIMEDGTVSKNTSGNSAGGIMNYGTFTLIGGYIEENDSSDMSCGWSGGVTNEHIFTMAGGFIRNNKGGNTGGGVLNSGTVEGSEATTVFTMTGGEIYGNSAAEGAGIRNAYRATFKMQGGKIYGNTASSRGGGISTDNQSVTIISDGEIVANNANFGGAIYNTHDDEGRNCSVTIEGGTISGNYATQNGNGIYNEGTLILKENAYLFPSDDIYLKDGYTVTLGDLTSNTNAQIATITLENYTEGTQVLSENISGIILANYEKFTLSDTTYAINALGAIFRNE